MRLSFQRVHLYYEERPTEMYLKESEQSAPFQSHAYTTFNVVNNVFEEIENGLISLKVYMHMIQ